MKSKITYQTLEPARKTVVLIFLFVAAWYLTWRLGTFNKQALIFSWLLYCAELYGFITTLMHIFMTWRLTVREAPSPREGLSVDVFVPTINEPVALLRKTLLAVMRMEYPHETWLLDDGRRPEVDALAKELGCRYLTRPDNSNAKAGNLNNALLHSEADFLAVFDADHAPKKSFLTRTLGYFQDQSVAFVQTPQDFYNLDSFQHHKKTGATDAWHEQSVFFRVIQRGKDYWNAAFFCGSCAILRRSALDAIGGFATGTVTEDLHTSVKIHKKGFRSVYHAESLAFGLAPSSVAPFLKQRIRWGQGAMQVWRKEGVFFCRCLTFAQRINYLASTITYFDGWQKGLFYITPAVVLASGIMPLTAFGPDFLVHFIPYFLLTFLVFEEVNRGYGRTIVVEQYNMARFAALAWSTLGIFKDTINFSVTTKERGRTAGFHPYIIPQALILAGNTLAVPLGLILYYRYHHLPANGVVANVIWASVNMTFASGVMLFTSAHSRHKRRDYRFAITLPAMLKFPDGRKFYGTVDDISSAGFRIYSALPEDAAVGTTLTGEVHLPSGQVKFAAVIKALIEGNDGKERYAKALGCSFVWNGSSERDKLDLFLYGSDMEWNLHSLREVISTPFERLEKSFAKTGAGPDQGRTVWNAVLFASVDDPEQKTGLISTAKDVNQPRNLLVFIPLPEGTRLRIDLYSRRGVSSLTGTIGSWREIDTPVSPIYIYQFIPTQTE
jgi:cellulose synthase (UDP-forming)